MITNFSHVMIYVLDVDRAAKWYEQILGFRPTYVAAPHYGIVTNHQLKLRIDLHGTDKKHHPELAENVGRGAVVYFECDDIQATVKELRGKGITVEDPRREGDSPPFTQFKDSEGNWLGLAESSRELNEKD